MYKVLLSFVFVLCFNTLFTQNQYDIIPKPVSIIPKSGTFKTTLRAVVNRENSNAQSFQLVNDIEIGKEGYKIYIETNRLVVKASSEVGFFYAIQTLLQLMPSQVYSKSFDDQTFIEIPCCEIMDYPRFPYRGLHLDVSRHIFPVSFIKKYIDLMAIHKFNFFHWHLTDDQGWRIEIKKYPKLQEIASQRDQTWIGHYNSGLGYDGTPYGGFYTQDEIKEVVEYARSKYITIVPEIEMPGHALAAITAYPELSCSGGPHKVAGTWGVFDDVFCTTEETFQFLENVLTEVIALFPYSPYIHIGGDESPKTRWKQCPKCQDRIIKEHLKDENELQTYFMNRMASFLERNGHQAIGWDEVLEGGIPDGVIIMSWRGEEGAIQAANANHYAIMSPSGSLYLDYYQGVPESEPVSIGGFLPLSRVYEYDPIPNSLPENKTHFILGLQGNLWTEYIKTTDHVEYMAYPRAAAVAEIAWSPKSLKNYPDFLTRLTTHFSRLDQLNVNYSKSHYAIKAMTGWSQKLQKPQFALATECKDCLIRYTTNGKEPNQQSPTYTSPIVFAKTLEIKAQAFRNGIPFSPLYSEKVTLHKATGKPYKMAHVNPSYSGGHPYALTDGIVANSTAWNRWVGTLGKDMDVQIDLLESMPVQKVKMQFFHAPDSWIYGPLDVSYYTSSDGVKWDLQQKVTYDADNYNKKGIKEQVFQQKVITRYIRIVATSIGKIPHNAQGEGNDAHLFCNEIVVE